MKNLSQIIYTFTYILLVFFFVFLGYRFLYSEITLKINFFLIFFYIGVLFFPSTLPPSFVFLFGLIHDFFRGTPLGFSAVQYLLLMIFLNHQRRYLQTQLKTIRWLFFILVGCAHALSLIVLFSLTVCNFIFPSVVLLELISTVIFYPFMVTIVKTIVYKYLNVSSHS